MTNKEISIDVSELKVYNTLYDWQKEFCRRVYDDYNNPFGWGFFLKPGIGKTKISIAMAELNNADAILVMTIKSKVLEENIRGSFGEELELAGYRVFYSHNMHRKKEYQAFIASFNAKEKIALVFNYEGLQSARIYQMLNIICGGNAFLSKSEIKRQGVVETYKNVVMICDESHMLKSRKSAVFSLMDRMFHAAIVPDIQYARENYFRQNIKHLYLLSGTPFTVDYLDLWSQLSLLGYEKEFHEYFTDYFEEDLSIKKYNFWALKIKRIKDEDALYDMFHKYSFFAKTEDFYEFLPSEIITHLYVPKSKSYIAMSTPGEDNPDYRTFDGFVCDLPQIFKMRLRQLTSGFMGNAEDMRFYSDYKIEKLKELLENNPDDYVIMYNYTAEFLMILSVCEELGYDIDVWNGLEKTRHNYDNKEATKNRVFIANIDSGSTGLNLQNYHNIIFFSLPDTWADMEQAIARIKRIGQLNDRVYVYILMMIGSVETRIYDVIKERKNYDLSLFVSDYWH